MNLKDLRANVRLNIDDAAFENINDVDITLMLNRAIRKVQKELLKQSIYLNKRSITVSFVSGTQESAIESSDRIAKIVCLADVDENLFDIVEEEIAKRSQYPCYYISRSTTTVGVSADGNRRNDSLGYYRVPTSSWDMTLTVEYKFTEFLEADNSQRVLAEIPEDHHDCLITWATIQILFRDEEPSEYWMSQWNDQLIDLVEAVTMENKNYQVVTDVYGD